MKRRKKKQLMNKAADEEEDQEEYGPREINFLFDYRLRHCADCFCCSSPGSVRTRKGVSTSRSPPRREGGDCGHGCKVKLSPSPR